MHRIWPVETHGALDQLDLEDLYGYPSGRPWLAVNFVSSADGAVEIEGRSAGLSNHADRRVYPLGSELADVVLVGAATAVAENFRGIRPDEEAAHRRKRHNLSPVPPVAVVTSGSLPPDAPVLTDVLTPTIVLTCLAAPVATRDAWRDAGADVLTLGTDSVDLAAAVSALADRGLARIHCDGGPALFGSALAAGVVDEVRLTISPMLVAGSADRIATGTGIEPTALALDSVLAEDDTLLLRYLVRRAQGQEQ